MESILRNVFIATPWLMLGSAKVRVSTHDYRGTFMYKQRQCYQDKSHCIDEQNDCCLSSYDPDETYCSNGTEIVFEGLDCNDGSHDGDHDGTFSYQSDAGSYFCCETIESDYVDESKCHDFATDCCAPPYFESGNATKYLYADCAYPWTLRWLYGEAGQCGHDSKIGKYECVYTSSTSTTTRNSKSDYLGTFIYEGRQCYQDKDHCIDTENDCCIGSYDNTYGNNLTRYCKGNTEVVFQGADCFDGEDLSTFKEDGGSYFCCEPVGDYTHHEDKCRDGGNDCCAPPPFGINDGTGEGSTEYEYLMAHCADGYTIQWLYEKTERCSYYTGAYECYSTTTTTKAPTTKAPTTKAPTTKASTTKTPTTKASTTKAPTTKAPATEAPPTEAPATKAPATEAPATKAPATEAPATEAPATEAPATKAPATTTTASTEPLFRNKVYGWMSCENVKDATRTTKECGVPYNFTKEANGHNFVKTCDNDDDFRSVVESCRTACIDYNKEQEAGASCEFYSVVKSESGCRCTLKNSYSLGRAAMVHKDTEWQAHQTLWFCDATKFVDPRYVLETSEDNYQSRCVYTLDRDSPESGGTWALNASSWSIVDACVKYGTNKEGIQKYCPNVKDY